MKGQNNFNVTQEFEIIPHQKGRAYTISVKEWVFLKTKINDIKIEINNFYSIGFLFLGAGASGILTVIVTDFKSDLSSKYITWSFLIISVLIGLLCLFFARDKHKAESIKPKEVLSQMELIESRFEIDKD
jgi:hypothetical protein